MKVTEAVIKMMFELSAIETELGSKFLDGEGVILRNNLLKLFNQTTNPESHDLIIDIMNEAGYPWFGTIAKSSGKGRDLSSELIESLALHTAEIELDDDTFMSLIPINGYIH